MSGLAAVLERDNLPYVVGGGVAVVSLAVIIKKTLFKKPEKVWPADTVILHQIGRGPYAPSMSPFPLKLETYLRMARIPYQNDHKGGMSAKGKTPWISYNGQDIADSQFSIDFLNKKLGIDLNRHLSPSDKAVAHAFQKMVEEHLYWLGLEYRWGRDFDISFAHMSYGIPYLLLPLIRRRLAQQSYGQGTGRHTDAELKEIYKKSLSALSVYLGHKKFFMGDEPCEVDCAIFGMLAQLKWHMPNTPHSKYFEEETPSLSEYCDRMKETFWPDWDKCITHGGTIKPET